MPSKTTHSRPVPVRARSDSSSIDESTPTTTQNSKDKGKAVALSKETLSSDDDSDEDDDDEDSDDEDLPTAEELAVMRSKSSKGKGKAVSKGKKEYAPYKPPKGVQPCTVPASFASSAFEWNQLAQKKGAELWAIRVPLGFNPSNMSSVTINLPSTSSSSSSSQITGHYTSSSSNQSYTLRSAASLGLGGEGDIDIGSGSKTSKDTARPSLIDSLMLNNGDSENVGAGDRTTNSNGMDVDRGIGGGSEGKDEEKVDIEEQKEKEQMKVIKEEMLRSGGEEMAGLRMLVPDLKRGGKLFMAPKSITRHLILAPNPPNSTSTSTSTSKNKEEDPNSLEYILSQFTSIPRPSENEVNGLVEVRPSTKRQQPAGILKYRNIPFGSGLERGGVEIPEVEVGGSLGNDEVVEQSQSRVGGGEGETPVKKVKKSSSSSTKKDKSAVPEVVASQESVGKKRKSAEDGSVKKSKKAKV